MRTDNVSIDYLEESAVLEGSDCPPVCRLATPGQLRNLSLFRVDVAIIGIELEEPESGLPLSRRQAENVSETVPDLVKSLEEYSR